MKRVTLISLALLLIFSITGCSPAEKTVQDTLSTETLFNEITALTNPSAEIYEINQPEALLVIAEKIQSQISADPEWFNTYAKDFKAGEPLPYHEKFGVTDEEYNQFLKINELTTFDAVSKPPVKIEKLDDQTIEISFEDETLSLNTFTFNLAESKVETAAGTLNYEGEVLASEEQTLMGKWNGHSWGVVASNVDIQKVDLNKLDDSARIKMITVSLGKRLETGDYILFYNVDYIEGKNRFNEYRYLILSGE
ncbi:MAG: hypothetical protein LCH34_00570 [Firmicutes bacterium]|nr:hypothetical protein [Bacillota bacterium]